MATAAKKTPATSKRTTAATTAKATAKKTVAVTKTTAKAEPAPAVKKVAAKPAVKKAPTAKIETAEAKPAKPAKPAVAKKTETPSVQTSKAAISLEHRYQMIETAAYFKAQQRGFEAGYHVQDWIAAEKEIDAMLNA